MLGAFFCPVQDHDLIEPETKVGANFGDAINCLKLLCRYQAHLLFAAEMLTKWGMEAAAAEQFRKEAKAAEDIGFDVYRKMLRVMVAKGMTDAQVSNYFDRHGLGSALDLGVVRSVGAMPYLPRDIDKVFLGDTARAIADRALWIV